MDCRSDDGDVDGRDDTVRLERTFLAGADDSNALSDVGTDLLHVVVHARDGCGRCRDLAIWEGDMTVRRERPGIRSEIALIPGWAFAVAAIVFLTFPFLFFAIFRLNPLAPEWRFQALFSFLPGTILAFLS